MKKTIFWLLLNGTFALPVLAQDYTGKDSAGFPAPLHLTSEQDHQHMMQQLHIDSIRRGADGNNPQSPFYANYDEAKANPYPDLPDPLILKEQGRRVSTPKMWWDQRRPEIVEDFDREIYGRVPKNTPKVTWELVSITQSRETPDSIPVITKKLIGHVDNSSYPRIAVNIQLTLTTPANAKGPVPVIMEFGFVFPPGMRRPGPPPGTGATAPQGPPFPPPPPGPFL